MRVLWSPFTLLSTAIVLIATSGIGHADETPAVRRALIFAPGQYQSLPDSELHEHGAENLLQQLIRSGFAAEHIQLLTGNTGAQHGRATVDSFRAHLRETVNASGPDDVLLVAIHSYGSASGKRDFVAAEETTRSDLTSLQTAVPDSLPDSVISMQEIVDVMQTAATSSQLLLVDGAVGERHSRDVSGPDRFGEGELQLRSGQYVVLNSRSGLRRGVTEFIASVCDGLTELADGDFSQTVSRDELVEHIQRYAESFELRPSPVVKGNVVDDFELATAGLLDGNGAFTRDLRDQMALTLMQSARHLMLIVRSPDDARDVLKRAVAYRPSAELKAEISSMLLTLLAAEGDFEKAWREAEVLNQPLLVQATGKFTIETGSTVLGTIAPGELVLFDLRQGDFLHPQKRFAVKYDNGTVSFDELKTPNGWSRLSGIKSGRPDSGRTNTAESLVSILRQLNGQTPPGTRIGQR